MAKYFKGALKVFTSYSITLILFIVFLYTVISIAGENTSYWLAPYSFFFFVLTSLILYVEMKALAQKEKRPAYNTLHYPLKGLVLGILGFLPYIIAEIVYPFISFKDEVFNNMTRIALHTLLGPVYVFIKLLNTTVYGYILATIAIPIVAMLGYLAGYYDFDIPFLKRKKPLKARAKKNTQNNYR